MTDIAATGYRASAYASTAQPHQTTTERVPVEIGIRADWGSYADARGVEVAMTEYEDGHGYASDFYQIEVPLDEAEKFAHALLAAVAARRAHPPTPTEEILAACVAFLDEHGGSWGSTWAPLGDLRERLNEILPGALFDTAVTDAAEAGDVALDATVTDPDEEADGVEVDGRYYTRLRPARLFRKES